MPTNQDPKRVFDGLTSLEAGMNARSDPDLLSQNQAAFLGNISLRGGIPSTRPPYASKLLGFANSSVESNFTGVFQGACFYEANDETENSIITSIGGRLFRIFLGIGTSLGGGSWQNTGFLNAARINHTATLLQNGKVLVVGGRDANTFTTGLSSCELYDPNTGVWTNTGSLTTARLGHTAILLASGKVLVAGGYDNNSLSSCELYDPVAGTWAATGTLNAARYSHTATLLSSGKVLVAAGYGIASAEIYDPVAATWATTGSLNFARAYHTATLLTNGNVLVSGGYGIGNSTIASAEIFNGSTWANTGSMTTARQNHTDALLSNGKVLVAGGLIANANTWLLSSELYDPIAGTWAATGSLNIAREKHTATVLANGKVLVVGGDLHGSAISSAEVYDSVAATWSITGQLNVARENHRATLLQDSKVLVAGGYNSSSTYLSSAELFTTNNASTLVTDITPSVAEVVTANVANLVVGNSYTIDVTSDTAFTVGQHLIIDGGSYTITAIAADQITVTYNGGAANTGWTILATTAILNSSSVPINTTCAALVTAAFSVPPIGQQITIYVTSETGFTVSENILIDSGSYTVDSTGTLQLVLTYNGGAAHSGVANLTPILGAIFSPSITTTGFSVPAIGIQLWINTNVNGTTVPNPFLTNQVIMIDRGSYTINTVGGGVPGSQLYCTYNGGSSVATVNSGDIIYGKTISITLAQKVTNNFVVPSLNGAVTIHVTSDTGFTANEQIIIGGEHFTVNTVYAGQNLFSATLTGGIANIMANTSVADSSGNPIYFTHTNPPDADMVFLYQAENYIIVLCENQSTMIFDGSTTVLANQSQQELPSSYVGVYAWGRNWLAQVNGHRFVASDLVGDPSGSPQLVYVDAILYMTENDLLNGGGAFSTPANLGQITAMGALSQLDSSLGIGPILVGTTGSIFSVQAPVDRTTWQNLRYPIQSVALQGSGPAGPRTMIAVNSDAWFRSLDGVRSLMAARRDFNASQSNTPNSLELSPVFDNDDQSLLYYGSLATFDNRIFITASPYRNVCGVAHRALAVVNLDTTSTMDKKSPPIWEGLWTGLNILQILSGTINGANHCYAFVINANSGIDLWELLPEGQDQTYDVLDQITNGVESLTSTSIASWIDSRAMSFGDQSQLKKLIMAELYLSDIVDTVTVNVYFRPDQYPLWTLWQTITICANVSQCTPSQDCTVWQTRFNQYGARIRLARPSEVVNNISNKPMNRGYQFQFRFEITGSCQIQGFKAHALMEQDAMEGECSPSVTCKTLTGCQPALFDYNSYG